MKITSRGMSLVELLIGVGVTSVLIAGATAVTLQSTTLLANVSRQSDVDTLFLNNLQGARNIETLTKHWLPVVAGSALEACLQGKGVNCTSFATSEMLAADPHLNAIFGTGGLCGQTIADVTAGCFMKTTTMYQWICTGAACTALNVQVSVKPFGPDQLPSNELVERNGTFSVPAMAFVSKGAIKMNCAAGGVMALQGLDYGNFQDNCTTAVPEPPCRNPSSTYGTGSNCQDQQVSPNCGLGYTTLGLYRVNDTCETGAVFTATVPIATSTPADGSAPIPTDGGPIPSDGAGPVPTDGSVGPPPVTDGGPPPATDGGPPPATDGGPPPATDGGPPPATDGGPPPATDGGPPPATDGGPPPATDGGGPPTATDGSVLGATDGEASVCAGNSISNTCGQDGGGGGGDGDGGGGGGGGDGDGDGGGDGGGN